MTYRNIQQLRIQSHKRLCESNLQKSSSSSAVIPNYCRVVCESRSIRLHMSSHSVNALLSCKWKKHSQVLWLYKHEYCCCLTAGCQIGNSLEQHEWLEDFLGTPWSLLGNLCSVLQSGLIKHLLSSTRSCYISLSLCEFLPYILFTSV